MTERAATFKVRSPTEGVNHLDLFSGIGGFALAARWVGWETVGFCEIDPYCQKVLRKHWPDVPIYEDVTQLDGRPHRGAVDIITGGFPCQDISLAGKGAGIDGERSGLWSHLARLIGEIRPAYAVLENVSALLGRGLDRVAGDLAEIGYDCEWHCIPASAVGAPHRRDRIWIVAYPISDGGRTDAGAQPRSETERSQLQQENWQALPGDAEKARGDLADTNEFRRNRSPTKQRSQGRQISTRNSDVADSEGDLRRTPRHERSETPDGCSTDTDTNCKPKIRIAESWQECDQWAIEPDVGRVADGVPRRVDRLRGLGNAIVPQVAEMIFRAIDDSVCQGERTDG